MSNLTVLAAEAHELAPLVLPLWAFPLIAAVFFAVTLLVTWSYRDVANRREDKGAAHSSDGHGAHHGSSSH